MTTFTASPSPARPLSPSCWSPCSWSPGADDHLIYQWVKFEGYSQSKVAGMLRISQPTVSRVIQRYERWQAHMQGRQGGRLDPQERLRAQRWLTYERNELILASCLRIADEMERSTELSKTTISRPLNDPLNEKELRTEQRVVDRSGVASRFLRLAFRVNMEQLKLAELVAGDDQVCAEPLSDQELAEEFRQAALDAAELAAARQTIREENDFRFGHPDGDLAGEPESGVVGDDRSPLTPADNSPQTPDPLAADNPRPPAPTLNVEPGTLHAPCVNTVNNLNNDCVLEITTTPTAPCTCTLQPAAEKNPCACLKGGPSGHEREVLVADEPAPPVDSPLSTVTIPACT